jgi:hypothetical protein
MVDRVALALLVSAEPLLKVPKLPPLKRIV